MTVSLDRSFVQQFSDNLIHLAQQKGSKLLPHVMVKKVVGKYAHFDRLGAIEAKLKAGRNSSVEYSDPPHSRRRVKMDDYYNAVLIDEEDELRMLIDPKSDYALALAQGLGRKMDDLILDAATAAATSVDASDSESTVALPAGQIIDEDYATTNSHLIVDKLIRAKKILMANEVDMNEQFCCITDAAGIESLLGEDEIKSADYNTIRALVRGEVDTFMGFKFVQTERINPTGEGNFTYGLVFPKSAIGLALGMDITVRMAEIPDKHHATQVHATFTAGAVRIEEEKVVAIEQYVA